MQGEDNFGVHCLDLGSGKGGASRWLAKEYGCKITAFNLGERQNAFNVERAQAAGIGHLVETYLGSFNEPLPADWTNQFDMVRASVATACGHAIPGGIMQCKGRLLTKIPDMPPAITAQQPPVCTWASIKEFPTYFGPFVLPNACAQCNSNLWHTLAETEAAEHM